ncbi:hypothetical protein PsorP6_000033 [Peronosclerospora sorghi]|uniref:Uncharacterized protein n=1 Tax=Peronosclerospora sorghi TaxID=230839 RepID=A0ACC0WRI3_9STRA|nr:hypothetical protein PsorP6_000033 [Peronosclerospora sorghi]
MQVVILHHYDRARPAPLMELCSVLLQQRHRIIKRLKAKKQASWCLILISVINHFHRVFGNGEDILRFIAVVTDRTVDVVVGHMVQAFADEELLPIFLHRHIFRDVVNADFQEVFEQKHAANEY